MNYPSRIIFIFLLSSMIPFIGSAFIPDESQPESWDWGFQPTGGKVLKATPPGFSWRPQEDATGYGIEVSRDKDFESVVYQEDEIQFTVHCPPQSLEPGEYHWRFRFQKNGEWSDWSTGRSFSIAEDAVRMALPAREELLGRIPKEHPRLFVRPEWMPGLRSRAEGDLQSHYAELIEYCDRLVADPPPTAEPPKYPEGMKKQSAEWKKMWYGNRLYLQDTLHGAASLAFAYQLNGNETYGQLARQILMECAQWDPHGSTGFHYNDEAGMPYNYHFARTYTFVHELLSEEEIAKCREVMRIRGKVMFEHLYPAHFWNPYGSHNNRAWHFLGELGIVFHGEIPEADEWVWFATNVFMNVYPVWGDSDGGWHEGLFYMNAYLLRFTYWVDAMKAAFGINALEKPFFSKLGYFPMYMAPPGSMGAGFGDLTPKIDSQYNVPLVAILAAQDQNPYWQWYVEEQGFPAKKAIEIPQEDGYFGFLRAAQPQIQSKAPADLPSSRLFEGIGQAALNSNLLDGSDNIGLIFKSSPYGASSHGYESQNAFLLNTFGEPMFIRSGRRDIWGSNFHKNWMWQTKSVNSILINEEGQFNHYEKTRKFFHGEDNVGQITDFQTGEHFDWVVGEMDNGYPDGVLKQFTRRILFCKPDIILIHDRLETNRPSTFQWLLHTSSEMKILNPLKIIASNNKADCQVSFLWPQDLKITQTNEFDPEPLPFLDLVEHHLSASTVTRADKQEFVTVLRPSRKGASLEGSASLSQTPEGFKVIVSSPGKRLEVEIGSSLNARLFDSDDILIAEFIE